MTPWSTEVEIEGDLVVVSIMLSFDPGPLRMFQPVLDVQLDEAHATELLGKLAVALDRLHSRNPVN